MKLYQSILLCLLLVLWRAPGFCSVYYVANAGSDLANGQSLSTPWQTIAKVNASAFVAGDQILFNRGDTWNEKLIVPSSGVSGNPIIISAYGSGANPIFTQLHQQTSWALYSGAIYKCTASTEMGGEVRQLFQDGVRLKKVANTGAMVAGSWCHVTTTIYVWLTDSSNPGTNHVVTYPVRKHCIDFNGKSYITVSYIYGKYTIL